MTLDDLVNYQTWYARGLKDGGDKERLRCLKICDDYGREGDPLSREYGCEVADEIAARIRNQNNA